MNKILAASALVLAAFLAWEAWAIKDFAARDTRPPTWDEAVQLEIALDCHDAIREHRWKDVFFMPAKPGMPPFPPLYHLAAMFAYDLSPQNPAGAALWLNWAYSALLCVSLFGIAWELELEKKAWIATVSFCAIPIILAQTHVRLLDLSVTAWAAAAYWAYMRCDRFFRWPSSLALGAIFAIGMMHKWSFFSFLIPIYFEALHALVYPESRMQPLAAAAIGLLGIAPWYVAHAPMLVPRLFQASADFGIPVWEKGAFAYYFFQLPTALGVPLFAFACVGLFFPIRSRRYSEAKLMHAWFLASYIFWAIVPNRQVRFLLPGLGGLSILACSPWPIELLSALAAFQIFTAVNFSKGWLPTWTFGPANSVVLFPTGLPSQEQWPIKDILKTAQDRAPVDAPFSNVTLVANHERFNGPNFTWMAKWQRFDKLRMRGVNRRLCEFSRFVVIKTGDLGPPGVTEGLGPAARVIENERSWFNYAYEAIGRWPLPDNSAAFLFRLKPLSKPPFNQNSWRFESYSEPSFSASGLRADLGRWNAANSSYDRATVSVSSGTLRGLDFKNVAVQMDGVELVPAEPAAPSLLDVRFLKMRTLRVRSLAIKADALKKFLEARAPGLKLDELKLEGDVSAKGSFKDIPVEAALSVHLESNPHQLEFRLNRARIKGYTLPLFLLGHYRSIIVSLDPNPETPFTIDLPGVTIANDKLSIP